MTDAVLANGGKTGHPPGLLQDDCRKLSKWLASRMNARQEVREACALIAQEKTMSDKPTEQTVTDALRLAAKSAAPYGTAMIGVSHLNEAADTIDNLRAQLAEARRDAERWRWLKDHARIFRQSPDMSGNHYWMVHATTTLRGPTLDAAIDAAKGESNG